MTIDFNPNECLNVRWLTYKRTEGLRKHVFGVFTSIFERKRFGFKVEDQTLRLKLTRGDETYFVTFETWGIAFAIAVTEEGNEDTLFWGRRVFFDRFDSSKMPNLRKLGTTIANKLDRRANWLIVNSITNE
jgi:hypothetical protein